MRNKIIHSGHESVKVDKKRVVLDKETLGKILSYVEDFLWLMDYYAGHNWAYSHISEEIKQELEK